MRPPVQFSRAQDGTPALDAQAQPFRTKPESFDYCPPSVGQGDRPVKPPRTEDRVGQ
jgi:hypothetical protein